MIVAMRIIDRITLAQRIEIVALSGMHLPGEGQVSSAADTAICASCGAANSASRKATSKGAL